jgi:hypothetical protein
MNVSVSVGKQLGETTARLVRELPGVLRDAFVAATGPLEEAASAGLLTVEPRRDGTPALLGLDDNLHAEVRDGRRGAQLVLTAQGADERGVPYAKILNIQASGVRKISKAALRRQAAEKRRLREAKKQERAERLAKRSPKARARSAAKAAAKQSAAAAEDVALMRGDDAAWARKRAVDAKRAERRAARPAPAKREDPGGAWFLPPRNPMTSQVGTFTDELLDIIVARTQQKWR